MTGKGLFPTENRQGKYFFLRTKMMGGGLLPEAKNDGWTLFPEEKK